MVDLSGVSAEVLGLFFGKYNTSSEGDEPGKQLTIAKDKLDHSSGFIVGRWQWSNESKYTIDLRCQVFVDGRAVEYQGKQPHISKPGEIDRMLDTTLFRWPNTARANKLGQHTVTIRPGAHKGVFGGQHTWETTFPETVWFPEQTFTVTLV